MSEASQRLASHDVRRQQLTPDGPAPEEVIAGQPVSASSAISTLGEIEVGIWEITSGTVRDVESDEVFVVLSGRGTVAFIDGSSLTLEPGVAVRLQAGDQTTWTIESTLRKIYITEG